jgi:hypothetical protein
MNSLKEIVLEFTDEKLLDVYRNQRGDYTEEAVRIFESEIARRGLDPTACAKAEERTEKATVIANAVAANLKRGDFEPLPYPFTKSGVVTANAVLRDSNIPYTVEKRDGEPELYDVLVYKGEVSRSRLSELLAPAPYDSDLLIGALPRALELIEEHFNAGPDGCYALRQSDIVDRIKSFSLYDIKISEKAAMEQIEVGFSEEEKAEIIRFAAALLDETDMIEEERGRVVFFHDSMEPLIDRLNSGASTLTRPDFLAIIEICQIYCDDPRYNPILNHIASSILDFFLE